MQTWHDAIAAEKQKPYFLNLMQQVQEARNSSKPVYPPKKEVFNAFRFTEFNQVKVVILGQDPYHGPNQANGLAFSVKKPIKIPPSLLNIYKELAQDITDFKIPSHGDLTHWAEQGVLLLNNVLTVYQNEAHSHAGWGWETFTDTVIDKLNQNRDKLVFLLWGKPAQRKGQYINTNRHYVLKAPHPSPLAAYRGFFGCKHFSKTNQILQTLGQQPINWQIPE